MTLEDIFKNAKSRIQTCGVSEDSIEYRRYKLEQKKKLMKNLMDSDYQFANIYYDVLVNRADFRRYMVGTVKRNWDSTPDELNKSRTEALEKAESRMVTVPTEGYEPYAVVTLEYHLDINKTSVESLDLAIEDQNGMFAFLWFDFENEKESLPLITW